MQTYVAKPSLPNLEDLIPHLERIWASRQLTNFGPYYQAFQEEFAKHFSVPRPILTTNGNAALSVACCSVFSKGEIITTPYSFVATSNVVISSGCKPVYADICPDTFGITAETVEAKINENTKGILATHCYGIPCDIEGLSAISHKYSLPLVYDCAHGIGVTHKGKPLCSYGDISCLSFHATKLFNTFEGGAIITSNSNLQTKAKELINFGIVDEYDCEEIGTNAKMNELIAAVGLVSLPYIESWIQQRKSLYVAYASRLSYIKALRLPEISEEDHNYSYMPVLLSNKKLRETAIDNLKKRGIVARRYFYPIIPLLSSYGEYRESATTTPIALDISERILCLPIYPDLEIETVDVICSTLEKLE